MKVNEVGLYLPSRSRCKYVSNDTWHWSCKMTWRWGLDNITHVAWPGGGVWTTLITSHDVRWPMQSRFSPEDSTSTDVSRIRTWAPEGTWFLVTRIRTLCHNVFPSVPSALSDHARDTLDHPVSEEEITTMIQHLPSNKAAGADGLRAELFKQPPKLWAKVLHPILETHLHSTGQISPSLRESIIILRHKKGYKFQTRNYRPIAVLNISAKILSGIYNNRLRNILSDIVPAEQTGFIPRRSISEKIIFLIWIGVGIGKRHFNTRRHPQF